MLSSINPAIRLLLFSQILTFFSLASSPLYSQNDETKLDSSRLAKKQIEAIRIVTPPKIDGNLDEAFWKTLPVATDFVEYSPRNGTKPVFNTDVRFAYDDVALYACAVMFDPNPDSIFRQLGKRDQIEQLTTDYLSFDILPYDDDLNMYEFKVSPGNLQNDCKYSAVGQDITWDAVWESAAKITDSGWVVEIKIPFSALRFPKIENQVWGINMWRNNQRKQEFSTWSWVDNKTQDIFRYYGKLVGMKNIKPPLRLSFSPYVSGYVEKNPDSKNWSYFLRGGLDLKLGINESYTLDIMLIPDFGQVQSDDIILNLSPFEVRYDEKRQFFTEATELFNKCGIFYTRRVGSEPKKYSLPYDSLKPNEVVTKNPEETRIINATKISGRNSKGLGIGVFNAMTTNTWAKLEDTLTGISRKIMTQPFTNYNVLVFDQNLPHNSYVTLINTNYYIPNDRYIANVTGAETRLCNKKNNIAVFGQFNVSQKYIQENSPDIGYQYLVSVAKPSGRFQYQLARQETNKKFDPNDLGFLLYNNETNNELRLTYHIFDPFWKIISSQTDLIILYSTLNQPASFRTLRLSLQHQTTFTSYWITTLAAEYQPLGYYDYYEPRVWGKVFKTPKSYWFEWSLSSDAKKMFRYQQNFSFSNCPGFEYFDYNIGFTPRIRFSDRFSMTLDVQYMKELNSYGWVNTDYNTGVEPVIYFGRRDITTINNVLTSQYIFNTKTSLSLRARHYWSQANYLQYYALNNDGHLDPVLYWQNHNINFNAFTVDLQFIWYFAPGSELSVFWKNLINTTGDMLENNYFTNFSQMIDSPQTNSFSFRVLYYLDYLYLKKVFSKKKNE
jgi:Domain of unknown function (DUF5916)/Carbohydrate family 9 binding domain-like